MEKLSVLISKKVERREWCLELWLLGGSPSHLFFADDLILFAKATKSQARVLRHTLCEFCNISGQRVSLSKSQVFVSPNTSRDVLNQVISMDACHKELGEVSWRATNS